MQHRQTHQQDRDGYQHMGGQPAGLCLDADMESMARASILAAKCDVQETRSCSQLASMRSGNTTDTQHSILSYAQCAVLPRACRLT